MQYKPYPKTSDTKNRMARKHARRDVFVSNKKMAKAQRKANRLKQKSLESEYSE